MALQLHFTRRGTLEHEPNLDAFNTREQCVLLPAARRDDPPVVTEISLMDRQRVRVGPVAQLEADQAKPEGMFLTARLWPIAAPSGTLPSNADENPSAWRMSFEQSGFISLSKVRAQEIGCIDRSVSPSSSTRAIVAASLMLPLTLAPTLVQAASPIDVGASLSMRSGSMAEPEPSSPASTTPGAVSLSPPSPSTPPPSAEAAVPDAAWNALKGRQVIVVRADGSSYHGELAGMEEGLVTLIGADGRVGSFYASEAVALYAAPVATAPPNPPPATLEADTPRTYSPNYGRGLVVSGAVVIAVHGSLFLAGTIWSGVYGSPYYFLAMGLPNLIIAAGVGIPLLAVGSHRRRLASKPIALIEHHRLAVAPMRTRGGWGGALTFRF